MAPTTSPDSPTSNDDEDLAPMPGFQPLASPPPDPAETTRIYPTINDDDAEAGWADPDVEVGPRATSPTGSGSSRASTERLDPTDLQGMTHAVVGMASMVIHWARARRRPNLHPSVWVADDEDQANIGDPMARLAARHAPIGGEASKDAIDVVEMMMGTTAYALKHLPNEALEFSPEEEPAVG